MKEKDLDAYNYLGVQVPQEPELCRQSYELVNLFWMVARARRQPMGMTDGEVHTLTIRDITDVTEIHEPLYTRGILDPILIDMDNLYISEIKKRYARNVKR